MMNQNNGFRLDITHRLAKWFDVQAPYFRGAHRLRNFLTKIIAPPPAPPQVVSTRYNFMLELTSSNDNIDQEIYYRGSYEAGTLDIIEKCLRPDDIFIDVGANIGLMSLLAATCIGKEGCVYAFEPEPHTYSLLQNNISMNSIQNILTFNIGLGATQGAQEIYNNQEDNRGTSSFIKHSSEAVKTAEVPITTLDDFVIENQIRSIRMMKVDVEGWEMEVLQGAQTLLSSPQAPIVCIEYNTNFPHHEAIYNFLISVNTYQTYILSHANWRVSQLVQIQSLNDMPHTGSPNLYCLLPTHLSTVPTNLFAA
ncbi:MAG TPA: FkbM family methyltransferase [Anaerolineae bacterium]|nr:FkbM family methyltransferase [Anaerolineae bacterium]